jgi:hypothetical protein
MQRFNLSAVLARGRALQQRLHSAPLSSAASSSSSAAASTDAGDFTFIPPQFTRNKGLG